MNRVARVMAGLLVCIPCVVRGAAPEAAPPRASLPPPVLHVCFQQCATWYLTQDGKAYAGAPNTPSLPADAYGIHIRAFTRDSVVIDRFDPPNQWFPQGLKAVITGKVDPAGERLAQGKIDWTFGQTGQQDVQMAWGGDMFELPGSGDSPAVIRADDGTPRNDDERRFLVWDPSLPLETRASYELALECHAVCTLGKILAERTGGGLMAHWNALGALKSWKFARHVAVDIGVGEDQVEADLERVFKHRVDAVFGDHPEKDSAFDACFNAGLIYIDSPEQRTRRASVNPGPPPQALAQRIDELFATWSQDWVVDRYVSGSTRVDSNRCEARGCQIDGHMDFVRGDRRFTIPFDAETVFEGFDQYHVGQLCYGDTTTGLQNCLF